MLHPLPALVRHWPEEWRFAWSERAGLVADGCRVSREESERLAEGYVRAEYDRARSEGRGQG